MVVGINLKSAFRYAEKRKNVIRGGNLTQDYVEVVDMPFEGPLFTREIVKDRSSRQKSAFVCI